MKIHLLVFLALLFSPFAHAVDTEGGNITNQNLPLQNATSLWYGLFGQSSSASFSPLTINATAANLSEIDIRTGSSSCTSGVNRTAFLFSISPNNITSLSAGNLSELDSFMGTTAQGGTATFTSTSTFVTSSFGTLSSIPTAYTEPASSQNFRMGYLKDQSDNFVFITIPVSDQAGFNLTPNDYQIILPTNSSAIPYYLTVDISCNATPSPTPTPTPGGGGSTGTVSPGGFIFFPTPPPIAIPTKPPTAIDLRIIRFSPFREVYAGDNIIVNPLIENTADAPAVVDIGLSGVDPSLSPPLKNVVIGSHQKSTIPFELKMPSDLPNGYYSFVVVLSVNGTNASYPSIVRVLKPYRIGQPTVKRQFSIDYEEGKTQVILTVSNPTGQPMPHLQVYETIPEVFATRMDKGQISSNLEGPQTSTYGTVEGNDIRWDVQDMRPYESRAIYYKVPFLITDLSEYSAWNVAQLVSIDSSGATEIQVQDLQTPSMLPGEKGELNLKLFNAGPISHEVEVDILGPQGWKITPRSMTIDIKSRESEGATVLIEPPQAASPGTYGLTLRIKYENTVYDKQAFAYIYKPGVEIYAPPISDQLTAWAGANLLSIVLVVVVGFFSLALAMVVYRRANQPKYDEARLEDLKNLERMMDSKKKGGYP